MTPYRPMMLANILFRLFGAALLVVCGGIVARSLTRPIGALDIAVPPLASGNRHPVDVTTQDEFDRLATSFNIMLGDLEAREAAIVQVSRQDYETSLANRRAMDNDLHVRMADAGAAGLPVAVIRVKRFRSRRAAIGHSAAAQAVEVLTARISALTEGATPYQISSTDIGLILPADGPFASLDALGRLVSACSQPATIGASSVDLMLCCGPADPDAGRGVPIGPVDQAVVAADFAEKRQEAAASFDIAEYGNPILNLSLMSEMLTAMTDGGLSRHCQPKYDLAESHVSGFETLIRWTQPRRGRVFLDSFIPVAEETGHIRQLTEPIIVRAIKDQRQLKSRGYNLPMSVNVSGRQLTRRASRSRPSAR